jgi:hypothetical protein
MRKYLAIIALVIFSGCHESDEPFEETAAENGQFEATVLGTEDCNMILLEFLEEDSAAIEEITDVESARYFAVNLSKVLLQPGQKLLVVIRKLTEDDAFACPTFAPTYPGIHLLSYQVK